MVDVVLFAGSSVAAGTGTAIVRADEPLFPAALAVITTLPAATAVTLPDVVTVATLAFAVDHAIVTPDITAPFWSRAVAVSVSVSPTSMDLVEGATSIVVTTGGGGGGGSTVSVPPPHDTRATSTDTIALFRSVVRTIWSPCREA